MARKSERGPKGARNAEDGGRKQAKRGASEERKGVAAFPVKVAREAYPPSDYSFPNARIGLTAADSKPDFPPPPRAPEGAPNVLLVLLDDVGYGWMSAFGGLVESPTLERLARRGLQYCQFHTTALCSPTRAALLTGRNHHTVSTGVIQEMATGFPGYTGLIPRSCAPFAEILKQNGYATGWWGKNHNVPDNQTSAAGPFDRWPTNMGFDYFYGFIGGETDQFYPALFRGTTPVDPPRTPEEGYQLTRDLADDCIGWMREQKAIAPERPLFVYFSTGAAHAPHHPPLDWRGRHRGKFDMGWDEYRKIVFERQKKLGVIPERTVLTPRPTEIPAWKDATEEDRRLYTRFMENYADFLEHADFEVGRVISAIEQMGELENTLILYIAGDNGASAEGTLGGTINEIQSLVGVQPDHAQVLARIDEIGLPGTSPHYPVGWAWAGDTPFQWTKQIASHFGGTRNGMVVSWPARITDHGAKRFQFHHVIDIAPTILEAVGIAQPTMVNGVPQRPIEGVSLAYTFAADSADAPSTRHTQYFEMFGNRALYHDGWIASCRHGRLPWITIGGATPFGKGERWELYSIRNDFSQGVDLAAKEPEKLRELQDLFMAEAGKYQVLPLDDRFAERADPTLRPTFFFGRTEVTLPGTMIRLPESSAPQTTSTSYVVTVAAEIPRGGADGVLVCVGGAVGGWTLFVRDRRLVYHYNWFDFERYEATSSESIPEGQVELSVDYRSERVGGPASVRLFIDGKPSGDLALPKQVPNRFGAESLDVGVDKLSPVCKTYPRAHGFPFTGRIDHVTFEFEEAVGKGVTSEELLEQHIRMD